MTAKEGFYGRDDVDYRKKIIPGSDEAYFMQVNQSTGEMEIWNEEFGQDRKVATLDKDGNIEFDRTFTKGARKFEEKFFATDKGKKAIKDFAEETIVKDLTDATITKPVQDPVIARKRASEIVDSGKATTPPDADPETVTREKNNSLSQLDIPVASGTRNKPGSFGGLRYPKAINKTQDFMKFTLLEYKAKKVGSGAGGSGFGFGSRTRVGPRGEAGDRTILGSVALPIPGGIRDENGCVWGGKDMNELQIQGSELARALTGASGEGAGDVAEKIVDRLGINDGEVKTALQESFAANAVGAQGLLARTRGAILNPNLELLFERPTLRPFSFTFDLAPRSKEEADEVVRIIRFFKQGSAPIRSESNLFLLAPHTFQVHYILGGDDSAEHPFIGKMKECAVTKVQVDYTPQQNYSTLKGGYMTSYKLTLQMTELEPVFNDDYRDDQDSGFASFREDPAEQAKLNNTLPAKIGF
jgi:hypothetical protein